MILNDIENNNWNKIDINLDSISKPINNLYLIHYALINKNFDIIKKILKIDPNNINKISQTTFINLIKLRDFVTILKLLKLVKTKYIKYIITYDKSDSIIFYFIFFASIDNLKQLLEYKKFINWNININNSYPLKIFLLRFYQISYTSDIEYIFKELLKLNKLENQSIIIDSCLEGYNESILNTLIKYYPDCINSVQSNLLTPLITSIKINNNKLAIYLLKNKVNYNYFGFINALIISLISNNNEILEILLDYKDINVNVFDTNHWFPSHHIFNKDSKIKLKLKREILKRTDNLNLPNINGNTTLHLLFLYGNWKDYLDILETKVLNLFYKNKLDFTPLDYFIKTSTEKDLDDLYYIVSFGYLKNTNIKDNKFIKLTKECFEKQKNKCIKKLANTIFKEQHKINFIDEEKIDYNLFISRDVDTYIYIFYFINKYKIYVPVSEKKYNLPIVKSNKSDIKKIIEFYTDIGEKYNYLDNLSIYWHDEDNYLIPNNLETCLKESKESIIFIFVTIMNEEMDHANCLIIDNDYKKIIHFEPYGKISKKSLENFDIKFKKYFKDIYPDFIYYAPSDFLTYNSFQKLSNENNPLEEKIGDIGGFCLAWTLWFLELYLRNRKSDLKLLVDKSIKKIIDSKYSFMEYIRFYANKLRKYHITFLNKINYPVEKMFNVNTTSSEKDFIYSAINNEFKKLYFN